MSVVPAGSPWSPRQRRWLQALGHAVYRAAGDEPGVEEVPSPEVAVVPSDLPVARTSRSSAPAMPGSAAPRPESSPAREATTPAASSAAPASRSAALRRPALPDRLRLALLRASGLDPSDPAAQAAMADWPVEQLRGDAAAKRAFWPRLRALRRPR